MTKKICKLDVKKMKPIAKEATRNTLKNYILELIYDVCLDAIEVTGKVPLVRDVVRQMWGRRPAFPVPSANQGGPFARPVPGVLGARRRDGQGGVGRRGPGHARLRLH